MLTRSLNISDLHRLAKKRQPGPIDDYLAGGADDEVALGANACSNGRPYVYGLATR